MNAAFRSVSEEERRLAAIDNMTAQLLLTEYSDSRTDMVLDAIHETSEAVADAIAIHMGHIGHKRCAVEKARHYEMIGRLIAGVIDGYCTREAKQTAEKVIDRSECPHCFDFGCRHCTS